MAAKLEMDCETKERKRTQNNIKNLKKLPSLYPEIKWNGREKVKTEQTLSLPLRNLVNF